MKLRVLHINKRYPPHVGGVERHVQDLARAQSLLPGVMSEVLCAAEDRRRGASWERDGRVAVHRVPQLGLVASNPVSPSILGVLFRSFQQGVHDVWHFHYPFPTGEAALVAFEKLGCLAALGRRAATLSWRARPHVSGGSRHRPVKVCTYHSDAVAQGKLKEVLRGPYGRLTRCFLSSVDRIIVSSPQLAFGSVFLQPHLDKVRVVPFGIDLASFEPNPLRMLKAEALREEYGQPFALFVGRLVPYKGVDVLLRAFAQLEPDIEATLVIVGDGPLRPRLMSLASDLGLKQDARARRRIVFRGVLPEEELVSHYHAASVLVLPSITPNEAFGLVQLEAHACGLPVISTDLPTGVPFANVDGVTGLVVEPGSVRALTAALELILRDEEMRLRLGRKARCRVEQEFTLPLMAERVLQVYEEVLA